MLEKKDPEIVILASSFRPQRHNTHRHHQVTKPTTAVIMATGYYDPNFVKDAMKKGASDFLLKPFELDKLMLVMMRFLRERKLLIENEK
jgi:DNA-binding NtrC family response regulator